ILKNFVKLKISLKHFKREKELPSAIKPKKIYYHYYIKIA
ncbi:hypothetical protein LCGC14_3052500, partial [marine sediment metagenome]